MGTPIRIPNLGAEATEARIVAWRKQVGDLVAAGEPIADIETEKATVELEAPAAGRIAEILAAADTDVPVGATVAMLEDA
jgi:2-oxoglutarate dehydrogenase E2 component (dihydrolipoamide succinyltransferase)